MDKFAQEKFEDAKRAIRRRKQESDKQCDDTKTERQIMIHK